MLKMFKDKAHDRLVVRRHGSVRRAVAKRQVRDITAIGHMWPDPGQDHSDHSWILHPVTRTLRSPRAERYIRYRNACAWFGIRY